MLFNENRMLTEKEAKEVFMYLKREETLDEVAKRLEITPEQVFGIVALLNHYDLPISVIQIDGEFVIKKGRKVSQSLKKVKPNIDECNKNTIGVVSDTHLCSKEQQLHMLNSAYRYFYEHEISNVVHCGDVVDGDYSEKRKSQTYSRFCNGADEQADYVIEMYPEIKGITTRFIQGSHDETHKINGGATLGRMIASGREDLIYLGQDHADIDVDGVSIRLRHPGGGVSKYRSRSPQTTIDAMGSGNKPNALLEGHYHKSYYFIYRNVHCVLVPCLCYQTQFMERKDISNTMGFYDIDIYSDNKGDIQYITPREHLFTDKDIKTDDWRRTRKLTIK